MKNYLNIFLSRSGILLLVGVGLMSVPWHWAHFVGYLFIFQSYDVLGYRDLGRFDTKGNKDGLEAYRVMQILFQAAITLYIYRTDGLMTALSCTIAWYMLACDVLYYFSVSAKLVPFDWFLISPVNAASNLLLKEPTPVWLVVLSALFGTGLGLFLILGER